jgi:hypothetical protein
MAIDINEARLIVEEAKKRGLIRSPGEPTVALQPEWKEKETNKVVLPDWLQESTLKAPPHK